MPTFGRACRCSKGAAPEALHLAHNQSGLRDYWAVAMLHGSPAEAPFGAEESARVIGGTRSLHFVPGTRYSYVNQNFRLLGEMLEARTGQGFADLLRQAIFERAGMQTAFLAADTRAMPDGTEGYEGTQATGFRPAVNRIHWTGDAGLGASLDDMIAWEKHIDATRDEAGSLYRRLSAPVTFADGAPAFYGHGLARSTEFGRAATGHGGALRGWRSNRIHLAAERISVVVMFNHLSDAHAAMLDLLAAALGEPRATPVADLPPPDWCGAWIDPARACPRASTRPRHGRVRLRYGHCPEMLDVQPDGSAGNAQTRLRMTGEGLRMERAKENLAVAAASGRRPVAPRCRRAIPVRGTRRRTDASSMPAARCMAPSRASSGAVGWSCWTRSVPTCGRCPARARSITRRRATGPIAFHRDAAGTRHRRRRSAAGWRAACGMIASAAEPSSSRPRCACC